MCAHWLMSFKRFSTNSSPCYQCPRYAINVNRSLISLNLRPDLSRERSATFTGKVHTSLEKQLTIICVGDSCAAQGVVASHCQRNRAPRLPDASRLKTIRQQQSSLPSRSHETTNTNFPDAQEDPELTASSQQPCIGDRREISSQSAQPRTGPTVERTERSEPWQIQFYEPAVRDILERAKQFSRCDASSVNAFPLRAQFNVKAAEYVEEAINERESQGLFVAEGTGTMRYIFQLTYLFPRLVASISS